MTDLINKLENISDSTQPHKVKHSIKDIVGIILFATVAQVYLEKYSVYMIFIFCYPYYVVLYIIYSMTSLIIFIHTITSSNSIPHEPKG